MKQLTNRMCESRGWSTPEKGKDFHGNDLEMGHVRAWSKDKYHCCYIMPRKAMLPFAHWQYWKRRQMHAVRMISSGI